MAAPSAMRRRSARNDAAASICDSSSTSPTSGSLASPEMRRVAAQSAFAHLEDRRLGARQRLAQRLLDAHETVRADRQVAPPLADRREQIGERHHLLAAPAP